MLYPLSYEGRRSHDTGLPASCQRMRSLTIMTSSRWDRIMEWPLAGLAATLLISYAWLVIARPQGDIETLINAALLGSVTAALASWFVERMNAGRPEADAPPTVASAPNGIVSR